MIMNSIITSLKIKCIVGLFYIFRLFPIRNNKIVASINLGGGYGDNPKYIFDAINEIHPSRYDLVWLSKHGDLGFPEFVRVVKYNSIKAIFELVTAKVWIDNRRKPLFVRKRKEQYYLMTWHGAFTQKKIEKDVVANLPKRYVIGAINDSKMADLFISSSEHDTRLYRDSFWYSGEILRCGLPRHDVLLKCSGKKREHIKRILGIESGKKLLLYAPTFREAKNVESLSLYRLRWEDVLKSLGKRFGGEWLGLVRLHPNIDELSDELSYPEHVINVTRYPDMQELLAIADCVITDYSSTILDYGLRKLPAFVFAPDLKDYLGERGFYLDIRRWPFPVAETDVELIQSIEVFDNNSYIRDLETYYNDYCGKYDYSDSSIVVAKKIIKVMDNRIHEGAY